MKVAWKVALVLVGLCVLAVALRFLTTHGHVFELLEITVKVVDQRNGQPLAEAVVGTALGRQTIDSKFFATNLQGAFELEREYPGRGWELGFVCAAKTTGEEVTLLRSAVHVTRWWVGPGQVSKDVVLPKVLFVEHPKYGRTIIPIDPETPVEEGEEPNTWRLDLGTIRVPPHPSPK